MTASADDDGQQVQNSQSVKKNNEESTRQSNNSNSKLKQFVEVVACHGVKDLFEAKSKVAAVFWTCILLTCATILFISIKQSFGEFYDNPIRTAIREIPKQTLQFPDIIICPSNAINYTKLRKIAGNDSDTEKRIEIFRKLRARNGDAVMRKNYIATSDPITPANNSNQTTGPSLIAQQNEILDASFDPHKFVTVRYNIVTSIKPILDVDSEVCYLLNMTGQVQDGPTDNLQIIVDLHTELDNPGDPNLITLSDGIKVKFGSPRYHPVTQGGAFIEPGKYARLALSVKKEHFITVRKFSKIPQQCIQSTEKKLSVVSGPYTRSACEFDCEQNLSYVYRKCLLPMDLRFVRQDVVNSSKRFCSNNNGPLAVTRKTDSLIDERSDCINKCFQECDTTKYSATVSFQKLPSHKLSLFLQQNPSTVLHTRCEEMFYVNAPWTKAVCIMNKKQFWAKELFGCLLEMDYEFQEIINVDDFEVCSDDVTSVINDAIVDDESLIEECDAKCGTHTESPLNAKKHIERWGTDIILLNIGFADMRMTEVTQSLTMTGFALLSSLGGTLGLWLGASFITILQLNELLLKMIFDYFQKRIKRL